MMCKSGKVVIFFFVLICVISNVWAESPVFPPEKVTGPFPTGMEPVRNDATIDNNAALTDTTRGPSDILHEYTVYKVKEPPVIDGKVDNDPVWNQIPWTVFPFWETNYGQENEFSIFCGRESDTWEGPENCTGYWKMLWDGTENVYLAIAVFDDWYNPIEDTENNGIHKWDSIQMSYYTVAPGDELTEDDRYYNVGFGVTDWNGFTEEVVNSWGLTNDQACEIQLADGNNVCGNSTTDGKAFLGSIDDSTSFDYFVYRYEIHFVLDSAMVAQISPGDVDQFGIMFLDHESEIDKYQGVVWGDVFGYKPLERKGSLLWSDAAPAQSSVAENVPAAVSDFVLCQNYPNPFNPVTTIDFSISKSSHVKLTVYDILGKDVATLVNTEKAAGHYSVLFDGTHLSSGVYTYQLEADGVTLSKKFSLLK